MIGPERWRSKFSLGSSTGVTWSASGKPKGNEPSEVERKASNLPAPDEGTPKRD